MIYVSMNIIQQIHDEACAIYQVVQFYAIYQDVQFYGIYQSIKLSIYQVINNP